MGKELGVAQLGGSVSGDLMSLRCQLVLQSSEDLSEAGGPSLLIWKIHMSDKLMLGISKRLQGIPSWVFPKACLSDLLIWQLPSLKVDNPREQGRNCSAFYDLTLEVTYHFCHILFVLEPSH